MHEDLKEIWFDEDQLQDAVKDLGRAISRDYTGNNLLLVGILKGCFVFMADLIRAINIPCAVDFMSVSSYGSGTESGGAVRIIKDLDLPLENYDVLIIQRALKFVLCSISQVGGRSISKQIMLDMK